MTNTIRDRLWDKAGKNKIPLTGAFELLPICNFSCKMCYVRKSVDEVEKAGGLLEGKQWLHIAKEAAELGLLYPLLTGGEPLLHPDFQEIYLGMLDLGTQVSMNTNGSLIDEKMAVWLGKHVPIRVNITLYGSSEESYQKLCNNGEAYEKVVNAVKLLKKYNVPVKLNTSITPYNAHELDSMIAFAKEMDAPIQVATYMFPPIRRDASMIGENDRLSPEEAGYMRVKADYLQNDEKWFAGQAKRYEQFVPVEEVDFSKNSEKAMQMACRAGACSFWIDWQGNLSACGMYSDKSVKLQTDYVSDLFINFKDAWSIIVENTKNIRYTPSCAICPNVKLCHPCITMVHNESGDINGKPEYLCRMNQAAAKYYHKILIENKL